MKKQTPQKKHTQLQKSFNPEGNFQTEKKKCFHSILLTQFSSLHLIAIKMGNKF